LKRFSTTAKIVVSAVILLVLFRKANLQKGIHLAGAVDIGFILISIALIVLAQFVRAFRLAVMLFAGSVRENYRRVLRIQMISFLPGLVSPAKIGEAAKIYLLRSETGVPLGRATACFVAERIFDMLLLVPLAIIGLYLFLGSSLTVSIRTGSLFVVAFAVICAAVGVPIGMSFAKRKGLTLTDVWQAVAPSRLFEAGAVTVLYWGFVFLEVWCFCRAAHFLSPVWKVALAVPPALLSSLLPISFSGFGVREAALVFLLQRPLLGASYDQALLISLMYIVLGLGVPALMGICYWMPGKKDVASQT
jgi:uncharacterized membrane protein YbhN (UPF0104 family)